MTSTATPPPRQHSRSRTPVRPPVRGGWQSIDHRWVLVGVSVAVVLGIIAFAVWGATGPGGGTASDVPIGQVTGPSAAGPAAPGLLAVGTAAPDLTWTLDGRADSLAAQRGHPVLLEFFATWCPHCQAEAPLLTRLAQQYAPQGLRVFGVSASPLSQDQRGAVSVADIRSYASRYGAQFPQLLDVSLTGAQRYGIRGFPTLYVVGKDGTIQYVDSGEVPEATLKTVIEKAL